MRKIWIIALMLYVGFAWAQAPAKINFQTVLHETEGSIMPNRNVKLIVNIISESANGDIVYREEHSSQSNQFGLINLQIGTGDVLYGSWADINWGEKEQYIMIELDSSGTGSSYVDMGIAQMLSVPYALFANESESDQIWQQNEQGINYNNGNVAIGKENALQDLELADDLKIEVSSNMSELADNALVSVQMAADTAQPNINWRNLVESYAASFSIEDFITNPLTASKKFILSSADANYSRRSRLEVKYDENIADVNFVNSKLIVNQSFISGDGSSTALNSFWAHNWIMNNHVLGIGDKNWELEGIYGNAAAELYTNGQNNFMVLNAAEGLDRAQVVFRRGNAEWVCGLEDVFYFKRNDAKKMKFMSDGKVKIGGNDPLFKLDVFGNVNIPVGYSYLIGGSATSSSYAEYFQAEESVATGSLAGINPETGLIRNYQSGDVFVGIVTEPTGFVANAQYMNQTDYVLVAIEGLVNINTNKAQLENHQLFTEDGSLIGALIGDQVLLK